MIRLPSIVNFALRCNLTKASNCNGRRFISSVIQQAKEETPSDPAKSTSTTAAAVKVDPLKHDDFFNVRNSFTMEEMFNARLYLGHKEGTLNKHMKRYLLGSRLGHTVIDLSQTKELLGDALNFMAHIAFNDGIILFVCRSRQNGYFVENLAREVNEYAHTQKWVPGTFTESTEYFESVTRLPDLVVLLNTFDNVFDTHPAVIESAKMLIPTIGVVDSASDPRLISYPIPANDDSPVSIQFFCKVFKHTILTAKEKAKQLKKEVS